jgi:rare lipoprotein A
MKVWIAICSCWVTLAAALFAGTGSVGGIASWYGEDHRVKIMANGQEFNPDKLTAASWFYPLGTRLRVSPRSDPCRSVIVTVTDRGPAKRLVRQGRIIDLSRAAFSAIADPDLGLIEVIIVPVD